MTPNTPASIHRADWSARLRAIAARPLTFRPDFPAVARRWEAWWRFESRSPMLLLTAPKRRDIRWGKGMDLLDQPAAWLAMRRRQVEHTHYAGDSIPFIRVDIGPVATAAFLGAPLHLAEAEGTSWQDTVIEDWEHPPSFAFDPQNPVLRLVLAAAQAVADDGAGHFLLGFPDLAGSLDVLANMRGPDRLCMDLFDHREAIQRAALQVVDGWEGAFTALNRTALEAGTGVIQWLGCWSDVPHSVLTCDFNALIGHDDYAEVCLPSIREQAQRAGRCIVHLDGPAAARHAAALAREPDIQAVQFTPGAGTPSALAQLDMLRLLQAAKKPILIICPADEVEALAGELDPRGLALWPEGVTTPQQADALAARVAARFP